MAPHLETPEAPSRELLIQNLHTAAEIEHGITCQYLFAAFSIKTHLHEGGVTIPQLERLRHFKGELLAIAREEMGHHGLALNLLTILGGPPNFRRPSFPHSCDFTPPFTTHELLPFDTESLERFARYEDLHAPNTDPAFPKTIGNLYQGIRDDLEETNRRNSHLFIGSVTDQITHSELNIREGQFDIHLMKITDLRSAQAALDSILDHDHFERVAAMLDELASMKAETPDFKPSRPVLANPSSIVSSPDGSPHPLTGRAMELFNRAYELMILMLERLYGGIEDTPQTLIRIAFFPLMTMVIRPLGAVFTQMPAFEGSPQPTPGPSFDLPLDLPLAPSALSAHVVTHERLLELAAAAKGLAEDLVESDLSGIPGLTERFFLLHENLARLAWNFERATGLRQEYLRHSIKRFR